MTHSQFRFAGILIFGFSLWANAQSAEIPLRVGVAVTQITPTLGKHEMRDMNGAAVVVAKVHDDLFAKVVVFEQGEQKVALVSLDLIAVDDAVFDRIRQGIAQEIGITQTICAVTHTHGSGFPSAAVNDLIVERTIGAARDAFASREAALIGQGRSQLNEGYNRRVINPDGSVSMLWNNRDRRSSVPVDDELGVISIRRASDRGVIVTLVNYSVHPVISMNFSELIVSSDYPGAMVKKVEVALGGHCVFLLGAAGDINPYDADMFRYAEANEVFATIDRVATNVSDEVLRINAGIDAAPAGASIAFDRYVLPMSERKDGPHGEKHHDVELITFVLEGKHAMVTMAGEPFVELGLDLKKRSPAESTWVIANAYGYTGYLPTILAACQGGYGASSATRLEVGAGERLITQAVVSIRHQLGQVRPLQGRP